MDNPTPKRTYSVKPDKDCEACHGSGEVIDWVPMPFGVGNTAMPSICECVYDNLCNNQDAPGDDEDYEIILDLSDFDPTYKLDVREG